MTGLRSGYRADAADAAVLRAQLAAMHLQWFAAEDEGRTEDPTEHKIRKAREEGKVAKSQDLASSVVLLFSIGALGLFGRTMFSGMVGSFHHFFSRVSEIGHTTTPNWFADNGLFSAFLQYFWRITAPVGAVAMVAAVFGNIVQVGFLFTAKPLKPDFKRIAPDIVKYLKKSLASTESLFNLGKATGKVLVVGFIVFLNIQSNLGPLVGSIDRGFMNGVLLVTGIAFNVLIQVAIILVVLSLFDFLFQRHQHRETLKMTKQEVKEERKQYDGDPMVKGRLRQRMREILSQNMLQNVASADVVVTNPTHFAVALEYRRESMEAPMVTAKGQDHIALRIREIALENSVPIVENRPLARALYAETQIGDTVPDTYYRAVAAVLKQVYRLTGNRGGTRG